MRRSSSVSKEKAMLIDVNSYIGTWPFRTHSITTADGLVKHLKAEGIDRAAVSSIESAFAPDPDACNTSVFDAANDYPEIIPVPVLNLRMPNWKDLLSKYRETHGIRAVKIHPSFHFFSLASGVCGDMCGILEEERMTLVIDVRIEDERFRHPGFEAPAPTTDEISGLAARHRGLSILCLNLYRKELLALADSENVASDIAFVEFFKTVESVLESIPANRILFGSHTPFFVTRAAGMKLGWADIGDSDRKAISSENAKRLSMA